MFEELTNNFFESTTTLSATTTSGEAEWLLLSLRLSLFVSKSFWQDGDHHFRHTSRVLDLEEWMLMVQSLLTVGAVVKVFADRALVTNTCNWSGVTAVTTNSFVHGCLTRD